MRGTMRGTSTDRSPAVAAELRIARASSTRGRHRATNRGSLSPAPSHREPRLLTSRTSCGPVVVVDLLEPGATHDHSPPLDVEIAAVPLAVPTLLVVAARVREKQNATRLERVVQLAEHARQVRAWYVKQRRVREHSVEVSGRQIQLEEVLVPHLAARVRACHLDEALAAIETDSLMGSCEEGLQVATRAASEVQDPERWRAGNRRKQGVDILGDVVILGPVPKAARVRLVVPQRSPAR